MTDRTKSSAVEWGISVAKAVIPIIAIGWYASQAIQKIEEKATTAVAQVAAAVADVRLTVANHVSADDQRQAETERRVSRVETRQDGIESVLAQYGIGAMLPPDRRRLRITTER